MVGLDTLAFEAAAFATASAAEAATERSYLVGSDHSSMVLQLKPAATRGRLA